MENNELQPNDSTSPVLNKADVSGSTDFWGTAVEFSKSLVVADIGKKFIDYCESNGYNHNERMLLEKMLKDAIGMELMLARLRYLH